MGSWLLKQLKPKHEKESLGRAGLTRYLDILFVTRVQNNCTFLRPNIFFLTQYFWNSCKKHLIFPLIVGVLISWRQEILFLAAKRSSTSPNVCLSVCGQVEKNVPECSRMHAECSRMFQNACRMFQNACRMFQNVPECSRMFQNACRMFQNVPECMQILELAYRSMSLHAVT